MPKILFWQIFSLVEFITFVVLGNTLLQYAVNKQLSFCTLVSHKMTCHMWYKFTFHVSHFFVLVFWQTIRDCWRRVCHQCSTFELSGPLLRKQTDIFFVLFYMVGWCFMTKFIFAHRVLNTLWFLAPGNLSKYLALGTEVVTVVWDLPDRGGDNLRNPDFLLKAVIRICWLYHWITAGSPPVLQISNDRCDCSCEC